MKTLVSLVLAIFPSIGLQSGSARPALVRGPSAGADTTAAGVIVQWFYFIERDQFDSLPPLLARDFRFNADGNSWEGPAFVRMIRGLGIHHPRIVLSNVMTHTITAAGTTVTYQRRETFTLKAKTHVANEQGTVAMVCENGRWRIRRWETRDLLDPERRGEQYARQ
jgi:hypothetical protein